MKPLLYKLHEYSTDLAKTGENLTLAYSSNKKFDKFVIEGNSKQEGEPSLNNKVDIKSCGDKRKYNI